MRPLLRPAWGGPCPADGSTGCSGRRGVAESPVQSVSMWHSWGRTHVGRGVLTSGTSSRCSTAPSGGRIAASPEICHSRLTLTHLPRTWATASARRCISRTLVCRQVAMLIEARVCSTSRGADRRATCTWRRGDAARRSGQLSRNCGLLHSRRASGSPVNQGSPRNRKPKSKKPGATVGVRTSRPRSTSNASRVCLSDCSGAISIIRRSSRLRPIHVR